MSPYDVSHGPYAVNSLLGSVRVMSRRPLDFRCQPMSLRTPPRRYTVWPEPSFCSASSFPNDAQSNVIQMSISSDRMKGCPRVAIEMPSGSCGRAFHRQEGRTCENTDAHEVFSPSWGKAQPFGHVSSAINSGSVWNESEPL
jgi:hypothetical protein